MAFVPLISIWAKFIFDCETISQANEMATLQGDVRGQHDMG